MAVHKAPRLSVIIPVFNAPEGLKDTVYSLLQQDFDDAYEIIIADNGSTDQTWDTARGFAASHPDIVSAVRENEIQSSYAARNKGITAASGEILCFIDADMTVPKTYLRDVRTQFQDEEVDYLACDVRIAVDDSTMSGLFNSLTGFPVKQYLEDSQFAPTCCLCVHRRCIEAVGVFDDRLESGGDMEFGQRVYDAGHRQAFAPHIILHHPPRKRFRSLVNKHRRIARGHAQLTHFYPDRYSLFRQNYIKSGYFHPVNPITLIRASRTRDLDLKLPTLLALSFIKIPLDWAGMLTYLSEAYRLSAHN